MVTRVGFDRLEDANDVRSRIGDHLAPSDDRRTTTVRLATGTPEQIVERVRQEADKSRRRERESAGMQELTKQERESLKRQHRTFRWQKHGFEAMRVKAAARRAGVAGREWMDLYEPGEGVASFRQKLRARQQTAAAGGGTTASERGRRTDEEAVGGRGRRARQAERASAEQVQRAKSPAFRGDEDAIDFLNREKLFSDDLFDISFSESDPFGRPDPSGRDFEELEEAHGERSARARAVDETRHAPTTRDPLEWASAPAQLDFPGIDTIDPARVHGARSERAQAVDENRRADRADTVAEWAADPDSFDLPGVDLPDPGPDVGAAGGGSGGTASAGGGAGGENPLLADDRDRQGTLDIGPDPTSARESRLDVEKSAGGIMEDTRDAVQRGVDAAAPDTEQMDLGIDDDLDDLEDFL